MKTVKTLLFTAMALALIACDHKELEQGPQPPFEGAVALKVTNSAITKADGAYWTGDQIGVMAVSPDAMAALYQNVGYATTSTSTTADFTALSEDIYFIDENAASFTAYAPYQSSANIATLPGDNGVISGSTLDQSDFTSLDYLFAEAKSADANLPEVNFTFKHRMSQLNVKVQCLNTEDVDAVSAIQAGTYSLGGLVHEGTFDVTTGEAVASGSTVSDWTLSSGVTTEAGIDYSVVLYPQTATMEFAGAIGASISFGTTQDATFEPGYSYTYTVIINANTVEATLVVDGSIVTDWDEGEDWTYEFDEEDDDDDTEKIDLSNLVETEDVDTYGYIYDGETVTIRRNGVTLTTTGDSYGGRVVIGTGVSEITFKDLFIDTELPLVTARIVSISASLTLNLKGDSYIYLDNENNAQYECMFVTGSETVLTINGPGSLTINDDPEITSHNKHGALYLTDGAGLIINSGTVIAKSGYECAGIGGNQSCKCGDIIINGGTVVGENYGGIGAGIGTGMQGTCGNIIINGGNVTADCTSGNGPGLGSMQYSAQCGDILILGGTVEATAQGNAAAIGTGGPASKHPSPYCGKIVISKDVVSVTTTDGNAAYNSIGLGPDNYEEEFDEVLGGIYLGAASADDESVTSWTPNSGQLVLNPYVDKDSGETYEVLGIFGWTLNGDTWVKDED